MKKLHTLKIKAEFAEAKIDGVKPFEIRKNDRNFEVGDLVNYKIVGDLDCHYKHLQSAFENRVYKIVYITDYEQQEENVVFAERLVFE